MCMNVLQSRVLKANVTDFYPNQQGCSKILQLGLTGMTHVARTFKVLIPPMLVSPPPKSHVVLPAALPLDAVGASVHGSTSGRKRGALGCAPGSQLEFRLVESPLHTCEWRCHACVYLQRGSQRVTVCSVLSPQGQRGRHRAGILCAGSLSAGQGVLLQLRVPG